MDTKYDGYLPELDATAAEFVEEDGVDLLGRWDRHQAYWDARLAAGLDPYARLALDRVGSESRALNRAQERVDGINFAAQDYLSLSAHPAIHAAAVEAIGRWGVHAAGSSAEQGSTWPLMKLEESLADLLCCRDATVFPSGWAAHYGAVRTLVRANDWVVIDSAPDPGIEEAAGATTQHVIRVPLREPDVVAECLAALRTRHPRAGILLVAESLSSLDSTSPDLRMLRDASRQHGVVLMVSVSHDLGALGAGGLGLLGEQGMTGEADVVVGSLAKSFASCGGFVAGNASGLKQALRVFAGPLRFSCALSPLQAMVVLAALEIVRSAEGAQRRRRLLRNACRLREGLTARAFAVAGRPSAIVPVDLGSVGESRRLTRAVLSRGALLNLLEPPLTPPQHARWRLHVMADHTPRQVDELISIAVAAREAVQG